MAALFMWGGVWYPITYVILLQCHILVYIYKITDLVRLIIAQSDAILVFSIIALGDPYSPQTSPHAQIQRIYLRLVQCVPSFHQTPFEVIPILLASSHVNYLWMELQKFPFQPIPDGLDRV